MSEVIGQIIGGILGVIAVHLIIKRDRRQVIGDYEKARSRVELHVIGSCTQCTSMKLEPEKVGYRENGKAPRMVCSELDDSPLETHGDATLRFENEAFGKSVKKIKPHQHCPLKFSV